MAGYLQRGVVERRSGFVPVVQVVPVVVLGVQVTVPGVFGSVALGSLTATWQSMHMVLGAKQGVVERAGGCREVWEVA
jgi:hypothetical protein